MDARAWNRLTAPLVRRLKLLVTRAVVKLVDPAQFMQELQVEALAGEVLDGVEHFEPYGFTSHPLPGAEVLVLSIGGRRAHSVAGVVADRRHRKTGLAPGEVALHNHLGDYVVIKQDRTIEVFAGTKVKVTAPEVEVVATTKVTFTSPLAEFSENVTIGGTLDVTGAVTMQATASVAGMATVGGLASTGTAGPSAVQGNLNVSGGDVTADGISLKNHLTTQVQPGAGLSGPPQ